MPTATRGWRRRPSTPRTTERTAADSFVAPLLRIRRAAGGPHDECRLRSVAVEPVVRDHAPEHDDARPENEREHARDPSAPRGGLGEVPVVNLALHRAVKRPGV